ncbi:MAG: hypothetical protein ABH827_00435 [bacterium]
MSNCSVKKIYLTALVLAMSTSAFGTEKSDILIKKVEGKQPIKIQRGDSAFTVGGTIKGEHFFKKNNQMLNSKLPDELEFFKNVFDFTFDFAYGEKKFEHKAVEAFVDLRHKGYWGLGSEYASSEATSPGNVRISDSLLGNHAHKNNKPLIWIKEGWLQVSASAVAGVHARNELHFLKLGWFPFEMGRGIALGSFYGMARELIGTYNWDEDKAAPGILLTGEITKDKLAYDVYYSKFEERNKSLSYTLNTLKEQLIGRKTTPSRGVAKDNDLFATRLKWTALNTDQYGKLNLEPYVFYNEASDQRIEILADSKTELGSVGLSAEHKYKNFEIGGDIAANFGDQYIHGIDRNVIKVERDKDGYLAEFFSHIYARSDAAKSSVLVTDDSKKVAKKQATEGQTLVAGTSFRGTDPLATDAVFASKIDRFKNSYKNKLRGWMGVIDTAYTFEDWGLTLALTYGYASGDKNPYVTAENKTYKGFIGVNESYSGKRVKSIFYDDRIMQVPSALEVNDRKAVQEMAFTNLHLTGLGATWKPAFAKAKKLSINPNMLLYWKDYASKKFAYELDNPRKGKVLDENASKFIGTELNLMVKSELLQDLNAYGNFGAFIPGAFYKDIKGVPTDTRDFFVTVIEQGAETDGEKPEDYRLGNDVAYFVNVGLSYSF